MAAAPREAIAPGTPVGAPFGWTEISGHHTSEAALAAADSAMYAAKP